MLHCRLLSVVLLLVSTPALAVAQDDPPEAPSLQVPDVPATEPAELFKVPDGDVKELLAFMNQVQQAQLPQNLQSRDGAVAFLKAQVAAVLELCKRIEAQKPDADTQLTILLERINAYRVLARVDAEAAETLAKLIAGLKDDKRPDVQKAVAGYELQQAAQTFYSLNKEQHQTLVNQLFGYIDQFGFDNTSFGLADNLAQAFEQTDHPQLGASIYERIVKEIRKLNDPRFEAEIARYEGSARRLNLPGNFMKVTGTTVDGKPFDWDSYRGKVVLVDFWASWCGPCREEIPNMKAQLEKYQSRGFEIVGISLDKTMQQCLDIVKSEELSWVNLMSPNEAERGWDSPMARYYSVNGIPTAILVDKEGKVVSMMARGPMLNALLEQLLGDGTDTTGTETQE